MYNQSFSRTLNSISDYNNIEQLNLELLKSGCMLMKHNHDLYNRLLQNNNI